MLTDEDILELRTVAPKAVILTSMDNSDTDTASETEDCDTPADNLPEPLVGLYDADLRGLNLNEIQERSELTFNQIKQRLTHEQCVNLEVTTKEQAQSKPWHTHRTGRITSTTFHRACTVKADSAKIKLVKDIMHYDNVDLNCNAVLWGRENEDIARRQYIEAMQKKHTHFEVKKCGLFVHENRPHLGASPDGVTTCSCCGRGTLEIKCPYKYRDGLAGCWDDTQFCLDKSFKLKKSHQYYHQVQLHMAVCDVKYCDFFIFLIQ